MTFAVDIFQPQTKQRHSILQSSNNILHGEICLHVWQMLDELAKEQRRMEEVQRISALAHLAVRERRLREAQESGTRQAEEMLRERENLAFQNAMGINNQTIDSYLQAIIEKAGAGNAQEEVRMKLSKGVANVVIEKIFVAPSLCLQ